MERIINGYRFHNLEDWQIQYLKENYQRQKLLDLEQNLKMSDWKIDRLLKALNLKRIRMYYRVLPDNDEVNKDLSNPYLSHVKIAKKYNTTPDVVAQRRKRAGFNVRRCIGRTLLEEEIAKILMELDIAFIEQKRIKQWSIDFYLGNHICLDIHGIWAHNKGEVILRDKRKQEDLCNQGYFYIVIHEKDIKKAKQILSLKLQEKFTWIKQEP